MKKFIYNSLVTLRNGRLASSFSMKFLLLLVIRPMAFPGKVWRQEVKEQEYRKSSVKRIFSGSCSLLIFSMLLMALSINGYGATYTENFDVVGNWAGGTMTSYTTDKTYSRSGHPVVYACSNTSLRQTSATQDGFAATRSSSTYSWRLENAGTGSWTATIASGGVGIFTIYVRRWDNSPDPSYVCEYSINNGSSWTNVQTINNAWLGSSDWKQISGTINTSNTTGSSDDIIIRIRRVSGERLMIDDFEMTDFAATPTLTAATLSSSLANVYGTASTSVGFTASGTSLSTTITATPQTGFEVSTSSGSGFQSTALTGISSGTTIYVRNAATKAVSTFNSTACVVLSSTGATSVNITTSASGNSVSAKALTITGLTGSNKVYNANTAASFTGTAAYSGLVNSESFTVSGTPSATFATKTVGTGKPITVTGYTAPSANYTLTQPALSGNITVATLTVTSAAASSKVYDATTAATTSGGSFSGVFGGDVVTLTHNAGTFAQATVGTSISVTSNITATGTDGANYTVTQPSGLTANITQKPLTITGLTANSKAFDGNTTATLSGTATMNGVVTADISNVTLGGTVVANFNDATVANGKPVTVTGYSITGSASGNYSLSQPTGLTANITSSPVPVISSSLTHSATYGTSVATYTITATNSPTLYNATSLPTGLSINTTTGEITGIPTANIGAYNVSITATNAGGTSLAATLVYTITAKTLTITSPAASNKVYDRTNAATITGSLSGIYGGDVVNLSGTGTFAQVTLGTGISVTSTSTLTGANAGNYTLTQPTGLTANITAKALSVTGAVASNKTYTGTNPATIIGASLVGVISPDAVTVSGGGTFSSVNVGTGISVTTALTLGGLDAGNYSLTQPAGLTANITTAALTITGLTGNNRVYNATTAATLGGTPAYSGLQNGESFTVSGTASASFATKTVGTAKPITVTGYTVPSSNYTLTQPTGLTANITVATLTISSPGANNKVYTGTNPATLTGTLSGVLGSDVVTLSLSGTFASVNAGTGITVTSTSSLSGADAANYTLTQPTGLTANITQAPLTATADNKTKNQGDANPTLTITYSGFVNSETVAAITPPSISTTAVTGSTIGTYPITLTGGTATNYNITLVNGILTVTNLPVVLAAWDLNGESSPTTSAADVYNANLDASANLTRGAGATSSSGGNSFRTVGFQNNGISTANTDYFETTLSAASGYALSFSTIDARFIGTSTFTTSPGVNSQFAYSLNGSTFTLIGSSYNLIGDGPMSQINLSGISALQNVDASITVTFRFYASGQTSTGGYGFSSPSSGQYGLAFGGFVSVSGSATVGITNAGTPATGNIVYNTTDNEITGFELTPSASVDFIGVNIATSGTATTSDISNFRLIKDVDNSGTYNGGDAIVATVSTLANPLAFTSFTETISAATKYLVIADLSASAVDGRTITASISAATNLSSTGVESGTAIGNAQTIQAPEIRVEGNGNEIVDGDIIPASGDFTGFGNVAVGASVTRQFTIKNIGNQVLNLSGSPRVAISGSTQFTVSTQPSAATISGPSGALTFEITYTPTTYNQQTASIVISNNDGNEGPYNFDVNGTGTYASLSTIDLPTFTTPQNINYLLYQENDLLSTSLDVMQFRIRDGGGVDDGDGQGTTLASIALTLTNSSLIKRIALYNGSTEIAEQAVSGSTVTFSSLSGTNVTSPNFSTGRIITVKVSFNTTVTDNAQFSFSFTNANVTSSPTFSSSFTNFGTISSEITGARNRVVVTATKLRFSQQPQSSVSINTAMSPSPAVEAVDVNNNRDLDYSTAIVLSSTGTMTGGSISQAASSGLATYGVTHTVSGSGLLLSATSGSLTATGNSNSFVVSAVVNVAGDYRTNPALLGTDYVGFASTAVVASGVRPWQIYSGGTWIDVTGSSATSSPEFVATVPPNIYITRGNFVDVAGGRVYNNIYVDLPNATDIFGSYNTSVGIGIATGKTLEITKGVFDLGGRIDLQGTAGLILRSGTEMYVGSTSSQFLRNASSSWLVENGAYVEIGSYLANAWTGSETFRETSTFKFTDWSDADPLFTSGTPISTTTVSGYAACFGNLEIAIPSGGLANNWTGMFPASVSVNLCHGNFTVSNNETDNISFYSGNTSTLGIGGDLIVSGTGNVQGQTGFGTFTLNVRGNFNKSGTGDFRLHTSNNASNVVTMNVDGNFTATDGFFTLDNNATFTATTTVNLKGNLTKTINGYMTNSNTNSVNISFNFTGNGSVQTVDAILNASNDMLRYKFFVKSPAYVQIKDQDWQFATSSTLTVESGGTLDFGFNGSTPLNLTETFAGATANAFTVSDGGTIKITSADAAGAIRSGTTLSGNVQLDSRTYGSAAIYHYIGQNNQFTGDGLPATLTGKVIAEMNTNLLTLSVNTGSRTINTPGTLEIRKGILLEGGSSSFFDGTGNLTMGTLSTTDGLYQISSLSASTQYPRLTGTYTLTGGTVELNGAANSSTNLQTLKGTRTYYNVKISGSSATGGYKTISSALTINNNLEITGTTIFDILNFGVSGNGGLTMNGSSLFRIGKSSFTTLPELAGIATPYALSNGKIEFYGTVAAGSTQLIRGTYNNGASNVIYYNIDVNATSNAGQLIHNVNAAASFQVAGIMNINSPAVFQLDATDIITGSGNFAVNAGATLKYANANGIASSGATGNIQTTTRSFSNAASYGFVGNTTQTSGTGLPSQVVNLFVDRDQIATTTTLTQPVTVTGDLYLNIGRLVTTNANYVNIADNATATITANPDDCFVIGPCRKTGNDAFIFPVGKGSKYRPVEISAPSDVTHHFTAEYFGSNPQVPYPVDSTNPGYALSPMLFLSNREYWDVARTGGTSNVKVKLNWDSFSSGYITNLNKLRVAHWNGSYWENLGNGMTTGTTSSGTIQTFANVTNFSPFALGSEGYDNPLPIELVKFEANKENSNVKLEWATAAEVNNDFFTVERTKDGNSFEEVGQVAGQGYSNELTNYDLMDRNPLFGTSYYRLKQTDFDGTSVVSGLIPVSFVSELQPVSAYFNTDNNQLGLINLKDGNYTVCILDLSGKVVFNQKVAQEGLTTHKLAIPQLTRGAYLLQLEGNGKIENIKLIY